MINIMVDNILFTFVLVVKRSVSMKFLNQEDTSTILISKANHYY